MLLLCGVIARMSYSNAKFLRKKSFFQTAFYCPKLKDMNVYYTQASLLQQGWSIKLINKYLGDPDIWETNPKCPTWRSMKKYDVNRVYLASRNPEVSRRLEKKNGGKNYNYFL